MEMDLGNLLAQCYCNTTLLPLVTCRLMLGEHLNERDHDGYRIICVVEKM